MKGGKKLPYSGLAQEDMLVVGEGGDACYLYLAQAKVGSGKAVMSFGLNLLADTPEAAALMSGLIDYAASDAFAPVSKVEMPTVTPMNGCILRYKRNVATDKTGTFTLTVPSSMLEPGKLAKFGVTAKAKDSRRWFAVMEM